MVFRTDRSDSHKECKQCFPRNLHVGERKNMKFFSQVILLLLGLLFFILTLEPTPVQAIYYHPMRQSSRGSPRFPWKEPKGNIHIPFGTRKPKTPRPGSNGAGQRV
ncbi:uncharacterized protein LOC119165875 isoform X2 [Rhipicephalus microplus]|uniref:uncharacterized protein LOC119165875 isoform X2 n=1 Tax=Rhipicephalus microplus TaxID=6941 RepID=UPI003F6D794B